MPPSSGMWRRASPPPPGEGGERAYPSPMRPLPTLSRRERARPPPHSQMRKTPIFKIRGHAGARVKLFLYELAGGKYAEIEESRFLLGLNGGPDESIKAIRAAPSENQKVH